MNLTNKEQLKLIQLKSLLNHLYYIVKDEDKWIIDDFHIFCRNHCQFISNEKKEK